MQTSFLNKESILTAENGYYAKYAFTSKHFSHRVREADRGVLSKILTREVTGSIEEREPTLRTKVSMNDIRTINANCGSTEQKLRIQCAQLRILVIQFVQYSITDTQSPTWQTFRADRIT